MFEAPQTAIHANRTPAGRSDHVQRVTLDVHDTGLVFRPGDRCAILPEHTTELVQRTLTALRASADRRVPLSARWRRALHAALRDRVAGGARARRAAALRTPAPAGPRGRQAAGAAVGLGRRYGELLEARDEDRVELWDALELAARAGYDVTRLWRAELWQDEALTRMIPPEPERMYSVSDRPDGDPFAPELVLTTGRLAFTSPGPDGEPVARHGTGSTYLARAAVEGAARHRPRRAPAALRAGRGVATDRHVRRWHGHRPVSRLRPRPRRRTRGRADLAVRGRAVARRAALPRRAGRARRRGEPTAAHGVLARGGRRHRAAPHRRRDRRAGRRRRPAPPAPRWQRRVLRLRPGGVRRQRGGRARCGRRRRRCRRRRGDPPAGRLGTAADRSVHDVRAALRGGGRRVGDLQRVRARAPQRRRARLVDGDQRDRLRHDGVPRSCTPAACGSSTTTPASTRRRSTVPSCTTRTPRSRRCSRCTRPASCAG